jgi:hypothetical protein
MSNFHAVALEALNLDAGDRLRLAAELIDSVDGPADPSWEAAWVEELQARRACGASGTVSWSEARERVLRRLAPA